MSKIVPNITTMKKRICWILLVFLVVGFAAEAQIKNRYYRPEGSKRGNFGKYPSKLRVAPFISLGSTAVNYTRPDSFNVRDTAFMETMLTNPNYAYWGNDFKNKSHFAFGLMFDFPFGRNLTFRPRISYSSKSVENSTEYVYKDSATNAHQEWNVNNLHKLSQLETMFMINGLFGSDWDKTRIFVGAGFGFAVNTSGTIQYDYKYISSKYNDPNYIWEAIDTAGTSSVSFGNNVEKDFFTRMDFLAQGELGVDFGNVSLSGHYNASLGSILTDPRFGSYVTSYYGVTLAYFIGKKPDLYNR